MSLYEVKPSSGEQFPLIPEDTHIAKLYSAVSIGEHTTPFLDDKTGKPKVANQVVLTYEFQDVLMEDGRPQASSKTYTASLHEKATLRKDLTALLGGDSAAEELVGAEDANLGELLEKALGKAAYITVAHEKSKDGKKTYANMKSIGRIPSTVKSLVTPVVNPIVFVPDPESISPDTLAKLPEFIRKKISQRLDNNKINISGSPF